MLQRLNEGGYQGLVHIEQTCVASKHKQNISRG